MASDPKIHVDRQSDSCEVDALQYLVEAEGAVGRGGHVGEDRRDCVSPRVAPQHRVLMLIEYRGECCMYFVHEDRKLFVTQTTETSKVGEQDRADLAGGSGGSPGFRRCGCGRR